MCKSEEETIDHLLLYCSKVRVIWYLIFSLLEVQWVMHFSVIENLLGWYDYFDGKKMNEKCGRLLSYVYRRAFNDVK